MACVVSCLLIAETASIRLANDVALDTQNFRENYERIFFGNLLKAKRIAVRQIFFVPTCCFEGETVIERDATVFPRGCCGWKWWGSVLLLQVISRRAR